MPLENHVEQRFIYSRLWWSGKCSPYIHWWNMNRAAVDYGSYGVDLDSVFALYSAGSGQSLTAHDNEQEG